MGSALTLDRLRVAGVKSGPGPLIPCPFATFGRPVCMPPMGELMVQAVPRRKKPWPIGDSEMAERIRTHDWAATPLGPIESWPPSLHTVVDICLGSAFASFVLW